MCVVHICLSIYVHMSVCESAWATDGCGKKVLIGNVNVLTKKRLAHFLVCVSTHTLHVCKDRAQLEGAGSLSVRWAAGADPGCQVCWKGA